MTGWQPIETAPKDGTTVLIHGRLVRCAVSRWIGAPHNHWADHLGHTITHWMPLPEAP